MISRVHNLSLRITSAAYAFLAVPKASAQIFGEIPPIGGFTGTDTGAIRSGVLSILGTVLSFMALVAVIVIVIAGIRLVVSQGEEQEKDKAKKTIFYAIIGLVVILLAQAIVGFIADLVNL